jgi:ferredoxin
MTVFGLEKGAQGITVGKNSYLTSHPKVFAIGNALRNSKMAVRSAGQGKEVATVIDNFLKTKEITPHQERFSSKFGRLAEAEFEHYLKDSVTAPRQQAGLEGFSMEAAMTEAKRCMHCDCRNPESCVLRKLSDDYKVSQKRFSSEERKPIEKLIHRQGVVYESNKCIKCGICVRLTRQYKEEYGFTFVGRGFDVKVGVSFNEGIEKGLAKTAAVVAKACPTGALSIFKDEEQL